MSAVQFDKYVTIPLAKLVKAEWNYKQDDPELSAKLVANLKRNGQIENIIVRELKTGFFEIVNGNHRFDALKAISVKKAVCFNLGKISDAAARRIAIETNETRFSTNEQKLSELMQQISSEFSMEDLVSSMPFTQEHLVSFIAGNGGRGYGGESSSIVEVEPISEPRDIYVRSGDLIRLGNHALRCADCTTSGILKALAKDRVVDCVVTDPPYGVAYAGGMKARAAIENDALDEESLGKLWNICVGELLEVLKEGGAFYASIPSRPTGLVFENELKARGILRQRLVWNKNNMALGHSDYRYKHEPILYGWKPGGSHYFIDDRSKSSVLDFPKPQSSEEHPTMKPIALWAELISNSTKPGQLVCDPFLGSGTTLLASEELNRVCIGTEIEPKYCQVIIDRYQDLCERTGKKFVCTINGKKIEKCTPVKA